MTTEPVLRYLVTWADGAGRCEQRFETALAALKCRDEHSGAQVWQLDSLGYWVHYAPR